MDSQGIGREDSVEDESAVAADVILVRVGTLANETVSTEHAELTAGGRRAPALLGLGFRGGGIEQALQVFVAKTGDIELAAMNGLEQGMILRLEGMKRSHGLSFPADAAFDGADEFL